MITQEESNKLRDIEFRKRNEKPVSREEQQWVLTLLAREQIPVHMNVVQRAYDAGFDVRGIVVL